MLEVLGKQLNDKERELKAQALSRSVEADIMTDNFTQCKQAAEYWKEQAQSLANIAIKQGLISRGKYAEIMKIDRCDIDETIERWNCTPKDDGRE